MPRKSPFDPDYKPYGTYTGRRGSVDDWREAFAARFTDEEIKEYLGENTPWAILGIEVGSSEDVIKRAYRKKAREFHPDLHPGIDRIHMQRVNAAYQELMR